MGRAYTKYLMVLVIALMSMTLPLISMRTTMELSEKSRLIDTSDAIERHLETACINALEANLDYSAKANGVSILKPGHTVQADIINEMERVLSSYVANNNFLAPPTVTINSVAVGAGNNLDAEGRTSNFGSIGSADVTVDGFTGNFPSVSATVTYNFRSVLANVTMPSQTNTVSAELNHTHIQQNNWND